MDSGWLSLATGGLFTDRISSRLDGVHADTRLLDGKTRLSGGLEGACMHCEWIWPRRRGVRSSSRLQRPWKVGDCDSTRSTERSSAVASSFVDIVALDD